MGFFSQYIMLHLWTSLGNKHYSPSQALLLYSVLVNVWGHDEDLLWWCAGSAAQHNLSWFSWMGRLQGRRWDGDKCVTAYDLTIHSVSCSEITLDEAVLLFVAPVDIWLIHFWFGTCWRRLPDCCSGLLFRARLLTTNRKILSCGYDLIGMLLAGKLFCKTRRSPSGKIRPYLVRSRLYWSKQWRDVRITCSFLFFVQVQGHRCSTGETTTGIKHQWPTKTERARERGAHTQVTMWDEWDWSTWTHRTQVIVMKQMNPLWNRQKRRVTDRPDNFLHLLSKMFIFFINLQNSKILESLLDSDVFGNRLLAFAALTATFQVNSRGHAFQLNYRIFDIILFLLNIAVPSV